MRFSLGRKDHGGAMVVGTFEKLVLLFGMLHHLVSAGKDHLAVSFKTWISRFGVVLSHHVPLEVACLSERLLVRTTWVYAD
jgi:hypothetical protein